MYRTIEERWETRGSGRIDGKMEAEAGEGGEVQAEFEAEIANTDGHYRASM